MTPTFLCTRASLRGRWHSLVLQVLVVALAGGAVLAVVAGARRTETAYPRFLRAERAADVLTFFGGPGAPAPAAVADLPGVSDATWGLALGAAEPDLAPLVLTDGRHGRSVNGMKLLSGRSVDRSNPREAVIGFVLARSRHLAVGDQIELHLLAGGSAPLRTTFTIVGIEASPGEFPPRSATTALPVFVSPAFLHTPTGRAVADAGGLDTSYVAVRLDRNADEHAFEAALRVLTNGDAGVGRVADQTVEVQRSMHLQAVALWAVGGFGALTVVLLLLQLFARDAIEDAGDHASLQALGFTSRERRRPGLLRFGLVAAAGGALAAPVAVLLSPAFPMGLARVAEPHPGVAVDGLVIGLGALVTGLVVGGVGVIAQRRAARRAAAAPTLGASAADRPGRLVRAAEHLPVALAAGARLALEGGRGPRAIPARATLAAGALGLGAVAGALTFGASLGHLLRTPALYGVTYEAHVVANGNGVAADVRALLPALRADSHVQAVAMVLTDIPLGVGRVSISGETVDQVQGTIPAVVLDGRLPTAPDEILVGPRSLDDLGAHLGSRLAVGVPGIAGPMPMRVVGVGLVAPLSGMDKIGHGALVTTAAVHRFLAHAPSGMTAPAPGDAFLTFRDGTDARREIATLQSAFATTGVGRVMAPSPPSAVANLEQVRRLPEVLAAFLALVAAASVGNLLVSSIRRRRRDLAVLRSLGFVPRQISAAIAGQAVTIVISSVLVGVPLGVAFGRWSWMVVAGDLGVVVQPLVPWTVVLLLGPGALLLGALVAAAPAIAASRLRPSVVLRSE